jgi:hypothetical protein
LGPDSPAGRAYKGITFQENQAAELQKSLEAISEAITQ